jgi:hypothetical protein
LAPGSMVCRQPHLVDDMTAAGSSPCRYTVYMEK